jgi:hypothetical protein
MFTSFIVAQWNEGLISTGEALAKIMTNTQDSDVAKWESVAAISLKLMEQEQAAAEEADHVDTEDAEERSYEEAGGDYAWATREEDES